MVWIKAPISYLHVRVTRLLHHSAGQVDWRIAKHLPFSIQGRLWNFLSVKAYGFDMINKLIHICALSWDIELNNWREFYYSLFENFKVLHLNKFFTNTDLSFILRTIEFLRQKVRKFPIYSLQNKSKFTFPFSFPIVISWLFVMCMWWDIRENVGWC